MTINKETIKISAAILVLAILALAVYFFGLNRENAEYSVVHLSSGELYVGHLSTFPHMRLTDGYLFQAVPDPVDPSKSTFQLSPLKDALWAPQYLSLNKDQVLFYGPLEETSRIMETIKANQE